MVSAMKSKSVNRGWLKRRAAEGKLYLKCRFHMSDDYAFDNAMNFGKMDDFKQAYLWQRLESEEYQKLELELNELFRESHPKMPDSLAVEDLRRQMERIGRIHSDEQNKLASGKIVVWESCFSNGSGYVSGDKQNGNFSVHSNLSYEYEIRS